MAVKTHWAIIKTIHGEKRVRSWCGRSSYTVMDTDTIEVGQNVTQDPALVTCLFCARMMKNRPSLLTRNA